MAMSERERRELHEVVEQGLGTRAADLLLAMSEPELPSVLRAEMAELRTEMAELRTEVSAQHAKVAVTNIGSMIGLAGLVLAAGALV